MGCAHNQYNLTSSTRSVAQVFSPPPADQLHNMGIAREYVNLCTRNGVHLDLCTDMLQPFRNPKEVRVFRRTYGDEVEHVLIPPRSTWGLGIELIKIAQEVSITSNVEICQIRNWYRPEPYNSRVDGGSSSQHLVAQAIDIDFCSNPGRNKALQVMKRRRTDTGMPRGIGTYVGGHTIHIDYDNRVYHTRP